MAFFGVAAAEKVDTLTETFDRGFNTSVREADDAPSTFAGALEAPFAGVMSGYERYKAAEFEPFTDPESTNRKREIADSIQRLRPDPKTTGWIGQLGFGLAEPLTFIGTQFAADPVASILSPSTLAMNVTKNYEPGQVALNMRDGMSAETAREVARTQATAMGLGTILPVSVAGNLATRILTGGALNVAVGAGERAETGRILRASGYEEMARQYTAMDGNAALAEFILGGVFGGAFGGRARVRAAPEAVLPSSVDAALTANQTVHAAVDVAPGVPVNGRSAQAHSEALNTAIEQLAFGERVNVEALMNDAGFLGKRPDFSAVAIIRDELEKAGFNDVAAKVRELEDAARARGLYVEPSDLNVVLSDEPAQVTVGGARGREAAVKIGNDYVPAEYRVMESADVRATMDKAVNQYRDRTRVASEQQIAEAAANLDPRLLGDSPVMDYGAPVLTADGKIIAGNGRAAFIERAYATNAGSPYRDYLKSNAEALGLSAREIDGMQNPVLVRVLQRDVNVQKSAILSNEGGALGMSALEQAKVDGERLGEFRAFEFGEDGSVAGVANMPFIRSWVGQFPQNQRSRLMDADGRLSAEGQRRLQNAVMYRAYGDSQTLARLVEATDAGSRNIVTALTRMAARVADAKEAIARGELYPFDLSDDLVGAVEKFAALRDTGLGVNEWVNQIDAFGDGLSGEARALVVMLDRNIRSARAITDAVAGYYDRLVALGDPKQGSMFEAATPVKWDVFAPMLDAEVMYSRAQTETPEFKKWFGDSKVVDAEGKPLVVYHGTVSDVSQFESTGKKKGFYFTNAPKAASMYAGARAGANVTPSYLSANNLYEAKDYLDIGVITDDRIADLKAQGYDGAYYTQRESNGAEYTEYVVFDPRQIKSAIGNRGTFDQNNPNILYGRGGTRSTSADLLTTFRAQFGRDADRLLERSRVQIVQSVSELPARADAAPHPSDVGGMYDPRTGTSFIVADNTAPSQIRGRVLHEIGVHAGFEEMLGPQLYADVLAQVETRLAEADPVFLRARELASENAARPEHIPQETLAYLVENAPESRLGRRIIAAVRQWLYRVTGGRFVDLTTEDLVQMASAALRRQTRVDAVALGGDWPLYQIHPDRVRELQYEMRLPDSPEFREAVDGTPAAELTPDGLLIDLVRFQKEEQDGAQSNRTGVFYLPAGSPNVKHYKTGKTGYGGVSKQQGQTLLKAPLFVKGATGGKAPEVAYDSIMGKGAYQAMRSDVLKSVFTYGRRADEEAVYNLLQRYGADGDMAWLIIDTSREGNTLPYAIQENIVAHAVRQAGYDSVVGYSKGKAGLSISEVFDVREASYPARGYDSEIHPDFSYSRRAPETDEFYRVSSDAIIAPADELSPTTMIPTGETMEPIAIATERADAQIAEANTLEPGFLSAVECALVAGE